MLIKDVHEFCKLYNINIPLYTNFDHYIDNLSRSEEYAQLPELVRIFRAMEFYFGDVAYYKKKVFAKLLDVIHSSEAYHNLTMATLPVGQTRMNEYPKHIKELPLYTFFSCDIKEANYTVIRYFDNAKQFPRSWSEFCDMHDVHPALSKSKSFRQMIFGHLNPKRIARFQSAFVKQLVNESKDAESLVFVSPDEFIISRGPEHNIPSSIPNICNWLDSLGEDLKRQLSDDDLFKITPFRMRAILEDGKDRGYRVKRIYAPDGGFLYNKLFCVPGSKYHMYFKLHVLFEDPAPEDLYFYHEHKIAQWVY